MDEALTSVKRNESVLTKISCNGHMHINCECADWYEPPLILRDNALFCEAGK